MESIHSSSAKAKKKLRQTLQTKRQAIHPFRRMRAAESASEFLGHFAPLRRANRIGSYFDVNGEFPMRSINDMLFKRKKALLFPTIHDFQNKQMHFVQWRGSSRLKLNKFNIPEVFPDKSALRSHELDLVLVPLLGFDNVGSRLGMGGGFYDRYLAAYRAVKKPYVLGVAFEKQRHGQIETEKWDYPLDGILTETGIQRFRR